MDTEAELRIIMLKIEKWKIQKNGLRKLSIQERREIDRLNKLIDVEEGDNVQLEFKMII